MMLLIKERSLVQKTRMLFDILFSRVKTEATTDVKVHAAKMEQFLSQFKFNENARMLSVVVHDDLDGESLFIGHVGILVPSEDGYLFVEKLTFEELIKPSNLRPRKIVTNI